MRPGDSAADRLARARSLARLAPNDPESRLTIARAALEARDLEGAREAVAPLLASDAAARPSARVCLLMADLEETEGSPGAVREWLARAARAPRDRAWIAEGFVSDRWAPVSPSGKLDGFAWRAPEERLAAPQPGPTVPAPTAAQAMPAQPEPPPAPIIDSSPAQASPSIAAAADDPSPKPPDDPGARPAPARRGGFRLFS
jgi:HemY protein